MVMRPSRWRASRIARSMRSRSEAVRAAPRGMRAGAGSSGGGEAAMTSVPCGPSLRYQVRPARGRSAAARRGRRGGSTLARRWAREPAAGIPCLLVRIDTATVLGTKWSHAGPGREQAMCGIVGVLGNQPVAMQVVDALKRLEYRGYDSAGVATLEHGRLERRRAEGKLRNLELKLSQAPLSGAIGIGHTRWATHGKPNETNAHPHATDRLAVVHNGIIENFRELKAELMAEGVVFETETDTEVVAHLVSQALRDGRSPVDAVA